MGETTVMDELLLRVSGAWRPLPLCALAGLIGKCGGGGGGRDSSRYPPLSIPFYIRNRPHRYLGKCLGKDVWVPSIYPRANLSTAQAVPEAVRSIVLV